MGAAAAYFDAVQNGVCACGATTAQCTNIIDRGQTVRYPDAIVTGRSVALVA